MFSASSVVFPLLLAPLLFARPFAPDQIKNLVTFGDSYTDISAPYALGGAAWPVYAAGYSNTTLYPYARAGGTCSNKVTPLPYPTVFETQIPEFVEDNLQLDPKETVDLLWIGLNDLGSSGMLSGSNGTPNTSIVDVAGCAVNWVKTMYSHGARNFIFQNVRLRFFAIWGDSLTSLTGPSPRTPPDLSARRPPEQVLGVRSQRHRIQPLCPSTRPRR